MPDVSHFKSWPHPKNREPKAGRPWAATEIPYIELQARSNFSFLRGASHPEELVEQAAAYGYQAIALTDRHTLAGVVRAHIAAKAHNMPLIVGASVPLYGRLPSFSATLRDTGAELPSEALPSRLDSLLLPFSLLLYPTNRAAYGRLSTLLTQGKLRAPKGHCFLSLSDIEQFEQGLLAIAVVHSFRHPELLSQLERLNSIFSGDRLSLAFTYTYGPDHYRRSRRTEELSQLLRLPLVVTNDVHYHSPERRMLQDVLTCIRLNCTLREAGFSLFQNAERYLKPPDEMARLFKKYPQALSRSKEIAGMASQFSLDQLSYEYPHEVCPEHSTPLQHLSELTREMAKARYPLGVPKKVAAQIEHELRLIDELNYAKYFLTVYDIVRFAREQHILCQGRGAAANSAVCYVLGITAVDPGKIDLLFERFVSKERNEPPDIDIDFEHERREEVIQYIYKKYGRMRAALTAEVITYCTRSSIRDVGKVFGLTPEVIENCSKLLTRTKELTPHALKKRALSPDDQAVLHALSFSHQIRGFPRHLSQHVGGFIISEPPLCEIVPIENATMAERTVIEWDKDDIESMGMLKIDVLGLGMLTAIRKGFDFLNARLRTEGRAERVSLYNVPQEHPKVYDMICKADTVGVFQIESRAQMSMLPRLRPRCFYDLVIEVAIVRPGPIQGGMVHPYLRRRSGEEPVSYPSKAIEKVLSCTLGVPIFQEQVMELAVVAAGFTRGESDKLRRAMASWKKSNKLIPQFGEKLINGMLANGYPREFAENIFEQIKGFGEYGFPQSHSASFAVLVYASAWIKCFHPAVFAASLLNSQPMGFYQPAQIIDDAKRHGVEVLPVDVNHSQWDCTLEYAEPPGGNGRYFREGGMFFPCDGAQAARPALRLGMRLVKGLREDEAQKVAAAVKERGRFSSILPLWRDAHTRAASLKRLAQADAFSSMKLSRQQALWEIKKLRDGPLPLFEQQEQTEEPATLPPFSKRTEVIRDYQTVGLSLKAHPLSFLRRELSRRGVATSYDVRHDEMSFRNGCYASVCGMVLVRQQPGTANGTVFVTIEDETGPLNLIVWRKVFEKFHDIVKDSVILLAKGKVQRQGEILHIIATELQDLTSRFAEVEPVSRDFH